MAGIYIHIPFCKKRCIYCDFFSSVSMERKAAYVQAVCEELKERKDYLNGQDVQTVYFGGGTPSQFSAQDFEKIFETIYSYYFVPDIQILEITLEANPDDITPEYLELIKHLPFNRISLGIQSFIDEELRFLNRRHDAETAKKAIQLCQKYGFGNISIDLIYGIPGQTTENWKETLKEAIRMNVPHISAYHLIYEENTPLFRLLNENKLRPLDEELSIQLFEMLIDALTESGFEHYEISNFSRKGYHSRHNSNYWNGSYYLGVGASAHSYNGISRSWNKRTLDIDYRGGAKEFEIIDAKTAYNEFILTRLRTIKGISFSEMKHSFGEYACFSFQKSARKYLDTQLLEINENHIRLTRKGLFVSDGIMSDLML